MNVPARVRRSHAYRPSMEKLEAITLLSVSAPDLPAAARRPVHLFARFDGPGAADEATRHELAQARREAIVTRLLADHPGLASGIGPDRGRLARLRANLPPAIGKTLADAIRFRNDDSGGASSAADKAQPVDGVTTKGRGYQMVTLGNADNVDVATSPGLALVGGGTDVDKVFDWMGSKAAGGDFLVLRASGTGAYNSYIDGLASFDSVTTVITTKRDAASDPDIIRLVEQADAIFIAGGDQADYERLWDGTPLEQAILDRTAKIPIGGTSAGLAVLGETDFAALNGTVESDDALSDPYGRRVSLTAGLLPLPGLDNVITDSHFVTRDRMGRLVTFLARTLADGGNLNNGVPAPMLGIGINEQTALLIEPDGTSRVVSNLPDDPTSSVYLVRTAPTLSGSDIVARRTPLTLGGVTVYLAHAGETFDLYDPSAWPVSYTLSVYAGSVTSSHGADLYA